MTRLLLLRVFAGYDHRWTRRLSIFFERNRRRARIVHNIITKEKKNETWAVERVGGGKTLEKKGSTKKGLCLDARTNTRFAITPRSVARDGRPVRGIAAVW